MNKEDLKNQIELLVKDDERSQQTIIKQSEEIERLKERIEDLNTINGEHQILNGMIRKELQQKESIIKEVRELVENGTDFKSIYFKKDNEDLWKVILSNEIKEKYLEILDKGKE